MLDDPYPDPEGLNIPEMSPDRDVPEDETVLARLGANEGVELTEFYPHSHFILSLPISA